MLVEIMRFHGSLEWYKAKPNGQPRRQVDSTKAYAEFGFAAQIPLSVGLRKTVDWFLSEEPTSKLS